jgi:sugar phosphate permease
MFGWIAAAHQLGAALAAFVAGVLRVTLGTYLEAFMLSGLLCLVASLMVLFIGRRRDAAEPVPVPAE